MGRGRAIAGLSALRFGRTIPAEMISAHPGGDPIPAERVPATLGIGPLSRATVDAAIDQAYRHRRRLMLIASRRQIDEHVGGYVNHWTTSAFASYVRSRDPDHLVVLCRDHGGPWQHPAEGPDCTETQALTMTLSSFGADISAGFELLHIDTSAEGDSEAAFGRACERLLYLYGECHALALKAGIVARFEIGFERQGPEFADPRQFAEQVEVITAQIRKRNLPPPTFIVAQTGTRVLETSNDGEAIRKPQRVGRRVPELAAVCEAAGAGLKAHNGDYLPARCLRRLMRAGVAAVNVAPELGVVETRALLALLEQAGQRGLIEDFLRLAYDSGAWRKWLRPNSRATDFERAVIAGHYVFASPQFAEIEQRLRHARGPDATPVDFCLRAAVGARVEQLMACTACTASTPRSSARAGD